MTDLRLGPDDGALAVMRRLDLGPAQLLGVGGEAWVYALDDERVVRILRADGDGGVWARVDLVAELSRVPAPFRLPEVLETGTVGARRYVVERRLPGRSVDVELGRLDLRERDALVVAHLEAASRLGALPLAPRGWFGDLIHPDPVRTLVWHDYLVATAGRSLESVPGLDHVDPEELAGGLPACGHGAFVHLDACAANMLAIGSEVTAVIDVGTTSVVGDRRIDPLTAAVYLCAAEITPAADRADKVTARAWLRSAGLDDWFEPVRRWTAAYWAWADDDVALHRWCRDVLR